jgi:outer membrane receptor protein involved in Fe transport
MRRIIILLLFISIIARGGTTGKISGIVSDAEGGVPLSGVNIMVQGMLIGAATDEDGFYFILNVPPGTYTLIASMIGYSTVSLSQAEVFVDKTTNINFSMHSSPIEGEAVEVVADRSIIQKDNTSTVRIVDTRQLETMPVNTFGQVVNLSSGVTTDYRGTHIRGGRVSETVYEVDGLPVQDVHFGWPGASISNNAIAEISILSGGFNAEYGNAQSGVINIVTKEGGEKLEGNFETQLEIPEGGSEYKTAYRRYLASLGGPLLFFNGRLRFFLSGEGVTAEDGYPGWRRVDQPLDAYVFNSKLTYTNPGQNIKIALGALYNYTDSRRYLIDFQLRPQAFPESKTITQQYTWKLTHALTKELFYDLSFGYYQRHYNEHQPGKWWDIRQSADWNTIDSTNPNDVIGSSYAINNISISDGYLETNSDYTGFFDRLTKAYTGQGNLTKVFGQHHTAKMGFDITYYDLNYLTVWGILGAAYTFLYGNQQAVIENGKIVRKETPDWLHLSPVQPKIYGFYLQDKMEYSGMVMNLGLRFDMFNPEASKPGDMWRAFYPADDTLHYPNNPAPWTYGGPDYDIPVLRNLEKASIKHYFSPRLGVSYPILEKDIMHFSYGHFVQIPPLQNLYQNQNYSYDWWFIVGNPDLEWEKTISYEIGITHAFTKEFAINLTAFYKDINNLTNISNFADPSDPNVPEDDPNNPEDDLVDAPVGIQTYINEDWGNVRGIELSLFNRPDRGGGLSGNISYTYMIGKGRYSDPRDGLLRRSNQTLPATKYYPLDWDMRHKVVANIDFRAPWNYGINLLINYGSGLPYTGPQTSIQWEYNDHRLPDVFRVDMRLNKTFRIINNTRLDFYVQIYNLLDRKNITRFNDESTYLPIVQYLETHPGEWGGPLNDPLVYDTHREIRGGMIISF